MRLGVVVASDVDMHQADVNWLWRVETEVGRVSMAYMCLGSPVLFGRCNKYILIVVWRRSFPEAGNKYTFSYGRMEDDRFRTA